MKYIRTKDEILIAPNLYDEGGAVLCSNPPQYETRNAKNEWGCVEVSEVIKTADTIEELCDEFVCQENENFYWLASRENVSFRSLPNCYCKAIYGAIWTDKGLIYVAKLNDKGELELL